MPNKPRPLYAYCFELSTVDTLNKAATLPNRLTTVICYTAFDFRTTSYRRITTAAQIFQNYCPLNSSSTADKTSPSSQKNSLQFIEPEGSLLCSPEPAICPYFEPDQSNLQPCTQCLFNIHYPPIYAQSCQAVFFLQCSQPKPLMHFLSGII